MSLSPVIDYWALLSSLNLGPAYRPRSQPWSLETHGSHIANGVELVPGAPGYQPQVAYNQWLSLLFSAPPLPLPTLSLANSAEGFAVTLSVAGTVKMSVSGDLGSFVAGDTLLTAQATVKEGFLTLSANGQTSTATSQYVVLGTAGDDSIDTSAAGNRVDDIFGGAGNDTLKGGVGNDVIVGGAGNDIITGGDGADQLTGGAGADVFIYTTRDESYYAGAGTPLDTIADFATGTDKIRFSLSGSAVDASSFATVGNFVDGKNNSIAYSTVDKALYVSATGTSLNNTTVGAYVVSSANPIAAGDLEFVIAGTNGDDVLKGGAGKDTITGGLGNDVISGGSGIDRLSGGSGRDRFVQNQGDSAYLDDPASTIANRTATGSLANGDVLKFPNAQIDIVTDFDSAEDVIDASAVGAHYTDSLMWMNYIRGQGHYAKGNWDGTELFTIDYATGRDILYFVSLNGANLAFNAFDIANGGIVLVGAGTTGFTAANIV